MTVVEFPDISRSFRQVVTLRQSCLTDWVNWTWTHNNSTYYITLQQLLQFTNGSKSVLLFDSLRLPVQPLFRHAWPRHLQYYLLNCSTRVSVTYMKQNYLPLHDITQLYHNILNVIYACLCTDNQYTGCGVPCWWIKEGWGPVGDFFLVGTRASTLCSKKSRPPNSWW